MINISEGSIRPARFVNVEKSLRIHKQIAFVCVAALAATSIGLASCQHKLKNSVPIIDTRITCVNIKPIQYVKSDSPKTKEAIIAHNAVWDYYCLGDEDAEDE